ncbi:PqqD family protein [Nonomuraea deserti]|uniref:PqqD family protein n=1 Tax=Nonomuraea deserti TaxID=1848322 RepID=UPI001404935C|nr:PqqD family protein [Nonomuraea deserti]
MAYREEKLATARTAVATFIADAQLDSVYLAGSLTAGLGSPTSDVDVFAITSDSEKTGVRQEPLGGQRLDIETYTAEWYENTLRKLADWELSRTDLRSKQLSEEQLDVLIRMRQSEVIKDSPRLTTFRDQLLRNEDKLRQMVLSAWAVEANGHLSDFRGAHQDGDMESAALIGQVLMLCAGKAVAAAAGDLYYGHKWVHCQLRRSAGAAFPLHRFSFLQTGAWAREDYTSGATEFATFTQTLMAAAQILGWEGTHLTEWPFWIAGPEGYRRNPDFTTIHLTQGVLLNDELKRQFVVQPHVALIWSLCNGRPDEEIIDAALHLEPFTVGAEQVPLTAGRVRGILKTLDERGLISRTQFR